MTAALETRADKTPYGPKSQVSYADPGYQSDKVARYPIDSAEHVKAAWSYVNQQGNASKYTAEQLAAIKGRIKAAAKKYGIQIADDTQRSDERFNKNHVPAGSANGGQFGTAQGQTAQQKLAAEKEPTSGHSGGKPRSPWHNGVMAYDPKHNYGPGYDTPGGDPTVKELQAALNSLGLTDDKGHKLAVDGKLGPLTTQAIKAAQKRLGLKQDGQVTPDLLKRLTAARELPPSTAKHSGEGPAKTTTKAGTHRGPVKMRGVGVDICVRSFDFEFDTRSDGRTLEGYAAVFNTPAKIRDLQGDFEETILPGAFKRSLAERMPILQWDHGKDPRVGTVPIGAIQDLSEDSRGLHVRARLFDNDVVEPVRQAIEAQAVRGMSFRFGVPEGGDEWPTRDQRNVRDADVHELGPVAFPAYDATSVSVRSMLADLDPDEYRSLIRELAADLRLAVDLSDLTGRPDARSAGGGVPGPQGPPVSTRSLVDHDELRLRGIIK
jgi:HK97 family phage prohead protease